MFSTILKKIFGDSNQRELKKINPLVDQINQLEEEYQKLSETELKNKTQEFKERLSQGETVDDILCEAFATVKNACRRLCGTTVSYMGNEETWNMIPYDVQLIGGIFMHKGGIAEMQTGEGKTLTASLPLYLHALTGRNVQLVTVNDYLALRDSQWIGTIFRYLNLTVGCIQNQMYPNERRENYACDITYGTNSEFGFDYLRDMGMASTKEELVQRDYYYVIIDEIDSILIDEARTPLIISGEVEHSTHLFDKLVKHIETIYKKQNTLCNTLINELKEKFASDLPKDEYKKAILDLCVVKMGMPKNRQLLRLLEDPKIRKDQQKQELQLYSDNNRGLIQELKERLYFSIDEKHHDASLSEKGRIALSPNNPDEFLLPDLVNQYAIIDSDETIDGKERQKRKDELQDIFDVTNEKIHNISQLLRAYCLYIKDQHYIVVNNQVLIVDENTGRAMQGRRFSDGLHQALEAKENVTIEKETQTLASITIQNYFRLYERLAGMTGTAETEAAEFQEIYKLPVLVVPTNRPCLRKDFNDRIYKNRAGKYRAIIEDIQERNKTGQPILVGTPTVEVSEVLSRMLRPLKINHEVLNARRNDKEAEIVAQAGQKYAVTIATNMAGRGTDIKLGEGVKELGGLYVLGAARHDARRVDRQLIGRAARQGDLGETVFYISLEDDLMRLYGAERMTRFLEMAGYKDDECLENPLLNRTITQAQKRVENQHFASRKRTLQYDDVMNEQRRIIYKLRREILESDTPKNYLFDITKNSVEYHLERTSSVHMQDAIDFEAFLYSLNKNFPFEITQEKLNVTDIQDYEQVRDRTFDYIKQEYAKRPVLDEEAQLWLERHIIMNSIDLCWKDHLHAMDYLRQDIGMMGIAQKDPLVEYKRKAFKMFDDLTARIADETLKHMFATINFIEEKESSIHDQDMQLLSSNTSLQDDNQEKSKVETYRRDVPKVGRNDLCPCGSGQKYKKCHGK